MPITKSLASRYTTNRERDGNAHPPSDLELTVGWFQLDDQGVLAVELLRRYSNQAVPDISLLTRQAASRRVRPIRPRRPVRHRLSRDQVQHVVTDYRVGSTTRQLADQYGIGKTTVTKLLREHGVRLRHQGLRPDQARQAVQLYEGGKSVAQTAAALGLPVNSVYDVLNGPAPK